MKLMSANEVYQVAKARDLVVDETVRASVPVYLNPKVGTVVHLLVDFHLKNEQRVSKYNATGLMAVFESLNPIEFDCLSAKAIREHGRNSVAEREVAKALLARQDVILLFKDEAVMGSSELRESFGDVDARCWSGHPRGGIADIEARDIQRLLDSVEFKFLVPERALEQARTADPESGSPSL